MASSFARCLCSKSVPSLLRSTAARIALLRVADNSPLAPTNVGVRAEALVAGGAGGSVEHATVRYPASAATASELIAYRMRCVIYCLSRGQENGGRHGGVRHSFPD